jgi:uncharacterized membrane protein YidH (DUF202 family)
MNGLHQILSLLFILNLISCGVGKNNFNKQKYTKLTSIKSASSEDVVQNQHDPNPSSSISTKKEEFTTDESPEEIKVFETNAAKDEMIITKKIGTSKTRSEPENLKVTPLKSNQILKPNIKENISSTKANSQGDKKMNKTLLIVLIIIGFILAIWLGTYGVFWIAWGRGVIGALSIITSIIGIILLFMEIKKIRKDPTTENNPKRKRKVWISIISVSIVLLLLSILI